MVFNIGDSSPTYPLTVSGVPNATVTITNGKKTLSQVTDASGNTTFARLEKGTWDVTVTSGSESRTLSVEVSKNGGPLNVNAIPEFTYSGDYKIVNDSDSEISNAVKNWKIRFLTSGTLTFTALNGAEDGIDVFCVGGGGNGASNTKGTGGGGGYTTTEKSVTVEKNYDYSIIVGGATGKSSGFGVSANGGQSAYGSGNNSAGGNGGSGGAGNGNGGSDGGDGGNDAWSVGGTGQGTTTREFGEEGATLYAGGGGAGNGYGGAGGGGDGDSAFGTGENGTANTGGGAGGANAGTVGTGGSGIVIIRNAR